MKTAKLLVILWLLTSGIFLTQLKPGSPRAPSLAPRSKPIRKPNSLVAGRPVHILVPSQNIDLAVIDGYYDARSKTWTLTNDKAQYASITPLANNQSGNTFIYGHRLRNVFGRLKDIRTGELVIITTDNGHIFTYSFRSSYQTNPDDDSLFHYQGSPILTLQTCSGLLDQKRQLFTFDLITFN